MGVALPQSPSNKRTLAHMTCLVLPQDANDIIFTPGPAGPADAALVGLEGAGLDDHLPLDGAPLPPLLHQDRSGARRGAVHPCDSELALGALRPMGPEVPL